MSRPVPKRFFFIRWESAGIVELIVWYLGWSCVTNHSTMWQASSWVAALLHAVASYGVPFSVSGHCIFSSNICLNTPTWSVDHHRNSYASIWFYFVSSPSLVFPSVRNPLTGNVLPHFEESAGTQKKHLSLLLDFSELLFEFPIFFGKMRAYWLAVKIMQQLRSSKHEGEAHSGLQRETS